MVIRHWQVPCNAIAWLSQFKIQMDPLNPVAASNILRGFFFHWVKTLFSFLETQFMLISVHNWFGPSCYKIGLFNHRFISFSFHHKFLCMVSDPLPRKSYYLQTSLTAFDSRQLSYWFSGMVMHTQTLTACCLCIYWTLLVAHFSVHALGSMNKLLLSVVSIWPAPLGNKGESQLQNQRLGKFVKNP